MLGQGEHGGYLMLPLLPYHQCGKVCYQPDGHLNKIISQNNLPEMAVLCLNHKPEF